jgi:hypothetical protein
MGAAVAATPQQVAANFPSQQAQQRPVAAVNPRHVPPPPPAKEVDEWGMPAAGAAVLATVDGDLDDQIPF